MNTEEAGKRLIHAAQQKFPPAPRCARCGFRGEYHGNAAVAGHEYERRDDPLVAALRDFVAAVNAR